MKMDFLILYEHRERELENACLIKTCLENKGYSVDIEPIYSLMHSFVDAKVIIVPHLYDDNQVKAFISKYKNRICKVINMQYEQVLSTDPKNSDYSKPKGSAKNSIIFAWGDVEKERYQGTSQQICVVGNVSMDFNSSCFDKYFLSKQQLAKEFNLHTDRILLFMSSFSMANYSRAKIKESFSDNFDEMCLFTDISRESRSIILDWFEKYLLSHPNEDMVYRPHPAEEIDDTLLALQSRVKNFHIIRKYSIRQWIKMSDVLLNWFSTSVVDAYYAGKKSILLRPIEIPHSLDVPFLENCKSVNNYIDMENSILNDCDSSINDYEICRYYGEKSNKLVIDKFVEKCVEVYSDDKYDYKWVIKENGKMQIIRSLIRDLLYDINSLIRLDGLYKIIFINNTKLYKKSMYIQREIYGYRKQVKEYCTRLRKLNI